MKLNRHRSLRAVLLVVLLVAILRTSSTPAAAQSDTPQPFTVYLTFDDGPAQGVTDVILDTLKDAGIKATFFVNGSRVIQAPNLVKREFLEGHQIGNHLWDHSTILMAGYKSPDKVLIESFNRTDDEIQKALGDALWQEYTTQRKVNLFRQPGGAVKPLSMPNTITYNWNTSAGDDVPNKVRTIPILVANVLFGYPKRGVAYGVYAWGDNVIVLMHDTYLSAKALPTIIERLKAQGAVFATLPRPIDSPDTMPIPLGALPPCARTADNCTKENDARRGTGS